MNPEIKEISKKYDPRFSDMINYKNTLLTKCYLPAADSIENFEVYEDDIWLCGLPKSGTTWSIELIWNIANDLNFEAAKVESFRRFPYFEYSAARHDEAPPPNETHSREPHFENSIEYVKNLARPRFIQTHLPLRLLPRQLRTNEKKAKIIYVWRNPKDVCISLYHFLKWVNLYTGDFTNFCKLYLNDAVILAPQLTHILEFWELHEARDNVLILKYENMKADLRTEIKRATKFLNKNLNDDQITKLEEHLSFSSMKENPAVNRQNISIFSNSSEGKFMRKGEADQWKTTMSSDMIDQFDKWIHENFKNNQSLLRELV